jgi:hypothetical protein
VEFIMRGLWLTDAVDHTIERVHADYAGEQSVLPADPREMSRMTLVAIRENPGLEQKMGGSRRKGVRLILRYWVTQKEA